MDRWFSNPRLFNYLWATNSNTVGTVNAKQKENAHTSFFKQPKKSDSICP
jgi:hypothetical protein